MRSEFEMDEILELHLKYLRQKTVDHHIEYKKFRVNDEVVKALNEFNEDIGRELNQTQIRDRLVEIVEKVEDIFNSKAENGIELLVYDLIERIHDNEAEVKNYRNHHQLLQQYFEHLHERLPSFNQERFWMLVKHFTPYIKLNNVVEKVEVKNVSKSSVKKILECIVCPKISREDCYQIINNKLGDSDYEVTNFELLSSSDSFGFVGDHFKLKITIKQSDVEKEFSFFTKFVTKKNDVFESIAMLVSKKEEFFYTRFLPLVRKYEVGNLLDFAPKCYFSRTSDIIVLEDLSPRGFICPDYGLPPDFHWFKTIIMKLSKIHACSLILDAKCGRISILNDFKEYLQEVVFDKNNPDCRVICFSLELVNDYFVEKVPKIWEIVSIADFKSKVGREIDKISSNIQSSNRYCNVICHGDVWGGNFLRNTDGDCVLVDYQLVRYCPPAIDLLFLIYLNTDRDFRIKYMDSIIDIHYNSLKNHLNEQEVDINRFYTYETFIDSIEYFRTTGIMMALGYAQIIYCPKEVIMDLHNDKQKAQKFYTEDRRDIYDAAWSFKLFSERITGLMEDLCEVLQKEQH